jgi:hypothetical protein
LKLACAKWTGSAHLHSDNAVVAQLMVAGLIGGAASLVEGNWGSRVKGIRGWRDDREGWAVAVWAGSSFKLACAEWIDSAHLHSDSADVAQLMGAGLTG